MLKDSKHICQCCGCHHDKRLDNKLVNLYIALSMISIALLSAAITIAL